MKKFNQLAKKNKVLKISLSSIKTKVAVSVLEIVFVGQYEVFVCLDFVLTFFFPLTAKLIGPRMGLQFLKNVDFPLPSPLKNGCCFFRRKSAWR